jgi:peptidoglycan/LPS O-acetylase OafA/YrhL
MKKNISNLDLIRVIAIVMVLVYHCVLWLPEKNNFIWLISRSGKYGVDLFFALSGFLIGSLYFLEQQENIKVDKARFIIRRATRTMPPYFIILIPSFLGSYFFEGNRFDLRYLFFLQNYIVEIPYFKISWSLCIEEYFYALLPFLLGLLIYLYSYNRVLNYIFLTVIFLAPFFFRIIEFSSTSPFGYYETATHLRYDPLIAGVFLSYFFVKKQHLIQKLVKYRLFLAISTSSFLLASSFISHKLFFTIGLLLLGALFALLIASLSVGKQFQFGKTKFIRLLAKSSYAIYLTHALTINLIMMISKKNMPDSTTLGLLLFCISLLIGILFYLSVELPLMRLRDRIVPSKRSNQSILLNQIQINKKFLLVE